MCLQAELVGVLEADLQAKRDRMQETDQLISSLQSDLKERDADLRSKEVQTYPTMSLC